MNSKQTLSKARKLFGKKAAVRNDPRKATSPEQRGAASARLAEINFLPVAERVALRKERETNLAISDRYQYAVGHTGLGIFFVVEGQGDTWAEAIADAERRIARRIA